MTDDNSKLKVAILGTGWLGTALAKSLCDRGLQVHAAKTTEAGRDELAQALPLRAFVVKLPEPIPAAFLVGITHLVITIPPGGRRFKEATTEKYLEQIRAITQACSDRTKSLRVIFCSSTGVYGSTSGTVDEETEVAPETHSSRAIVTVEDYLRSTFPRLTILRFAGLIGPGRHPGRFYGGKEMAVSRADAPVNLIEQQDAVTAIELAILDHDILGVYNVCAAAHPTKRAFYGAAAGALQLDIKAFEPGGEGDKRIDSQKLRAAGWAPKNDGLKINELKV
ncbi:NAD-dependent epimerase/dehydratase family protein [Lewinella sp. 4G2]|uniref:NAD-dependent epimerase/dehydratase family protein n=1 Tax=Lewinella sp. 4G2 TaxID=1803372 RepID=UPI0007B4C5ED|nr:NAD-dependent epimerase/dehydratase family protein [Lewinella sp. 4G2]OAV43470.1 hypothetical protein A3850_002700 [Lewinella sp. 4G2]